jgi:polyvinyl alcohol dehydrogenase (cytochrome)
LLVATVAAVIAASPCGPAPHPPAPGSSWTMYRGDLARDGHPAGGTLDAARAARLALSWRAHLDGAVDGTPAVAGGLVIAGSAGGTLAAFDATTGKTVWAKHGLGAIASSPSVAGDRVLVTTLTGHAYAFGLARGDLEWDWPAPPAGALWASAVVFGDEVIVGVASPYGDIPLVAGRIVGLDLATGRERWSVCVRVSCEPGGGVWSTAAIDDHGTAFVGVGNPIDGVLAFDASTGNRKWLSSLYPDQNRDLDVGASPAIFSLNGAEAVAQMTVEGMAAVVDATSGTVIWSRELVTGSAVHGLIASPAYDGTNIYAASASPPTAMFALKPSDGSTAWRYDAAEPIYSAPAAGKGVVIFGTGAVFGDLNSGSVVALSSVSGHRLWSFDAHSAVRSGPALAGDYVVVGDYAGDVLVFRPSA